MLNDLALGYFKVLNETQNVLSNDPQYSKYQHIYEAILKLQHISKLYDQKILKESLESLSPYLASDRIKLHSIVDYILNTGSSKSESGNQSLMSVSKSNIVKELEFQNFQMSELKFLFHGNKSGIGKWYSHLTPGLDIILAVLGWLTSTRTASRLCLGSMTTSCLRGTSSVTRMSLGRSQAS